jgi:two-component system NtrC family response regulator
MPQILIVEDKASLRRSLSDRLSAEGYEVRAVATKTESEPLLASADLILTDLRLPDGSGLDILSDAGKLDPAPPIVLMTAYGDIATAVEAMRRGASDFLQKPFEPNHLLVVLDRALDAATLREERRALAEVTSEGGAFELILGDSAAIDDAKRLAAKVAPTDATVLLTGESGTGKELFARAIHAASKRSSEPFVAINCAAIPGELLENELFGSERGAFTGAMRRKIGRIEAARGGTVFLDEVGDLDISLQGKLLRFLQDGAFERLGGRESIHADVRMIAATNRDLSRLIESNRFRDDLYYRLSVFPIELPPLRDRMDDVPVLALSFLESTSARLGRPNLILSPEAIDRLKSYLWPGNVREIENLIERAAILCDGDEIQPSHLGFRSSDTASGGLKEAARRAQADVEKQLILDTLEHTSGNKRAAARELGISVPTLYARLKEYGIG